MRTDQLALLFALVIAANLVLLIALQLPRLTRRGRTSTVSDAPRARGGATVDAGQNPETDDGPGTPTSSGLSTALFQRMTRVVSFVFIGSAMAIVALTGTPDATAIIVLLAFALILIELFQDVLPSPALGRLRLPIEAAVLLVLLTVLVAMTGGYSSPYFFGYILVVGGAALSTSELAAAVLAVISSGAYLAAVLSASNSAPLDPSSVALVAFNLVAIALVMYMASVVGREHRQARDAALRLSRFDPLTGLLASRYFVDAVEQEIKRATRTGRPFAFILVDMDELHAINQRFGLEGGDDAIKGTADAIGRTVRATDVVGRNSGAADEFFVMLPETDIAGAQLVAENIRSEIHTVVLARGGERWTCSASIGVVTFPTDARTWRELKANAGTAENEAKRRGRDQVVLYRDLYSASAGTSAQRGRNPGRDERPPTSGDRDDPRDTGAGMRPATPGAAPWEAA